MEHEDSFDVENLVSTPTDWGLQMSPPSPPPLPLLPSHMNTDLAQSAEAVKLQAFELPMSPPSPPHTHTHTDWGLPMSPPSPPPLPLLPSSHMNKEEDVVAQSSAQAAGKKKLEQEFELPDITCNPTDVELVQDYLRPAIQRMAKESTLVNGGLPSMDPSELPGIARNKGRREKYYLTNHRDLLFGGSHCFDKIRTPNGFWKLKSKISDSRAIPAGYKEFAGIKGTINFHTGDGTKTNWIMNVYYLLDMSLCIIGDGLVLCHVFEADSPDHDNTPECLGCRPGACNGNHSGQAFGAPSPSNDVSFNSSQTGSWPMNNDPDHNFDPKLNSYIAELANLLFGYPDDPDNSAGNHFGQAFGAPSNASFNSTHPGSRPMHHHDTERRSDPYIAELGNLFDPDNSTDTGNHSARRGVPPTPDHGHTKKCKKRSDVWDYFTKIFARDNNGKVLTFAACNHCCKILTGNSRNGTNHLRRHTCPCKFKPVAAGRNAKGSGGDVNVLSS